MAKARDIPGLDSGLRLNEAASRTIQTRTSEIFEFAGGVLDTSDIERVHDMRVATRRLRTALRFYDACFDQERVKPVAADLKSLADALGARRDPDVALALIEDIATCLPPSTRAGVDAFEDELRDDQAAGNAELERALATTVESQLESRLLELAATAQDNGETFAEHAALGVGKRRRKLYKLAEKALRTGKADDLHAVRIGAKRLRYLYEISEPALGTAAREGGKTARALQDVLGDLHDCDVMSARIRERVATVPIEDDRYIGLEALASYLEAKRRVLHRQFINMWEKIEL